MKRLGCGKGGFEESSVVEGLVGVLAGLDVVVCFGFRSG